MRNQPNGGHRFKNKNQTSSSSVGQSAGFGGAPAQQNGGTYSSGGKEEQPANNAQIKMRIRHTEGAQYHSQPNPTEVKQS